MYFNMLYTCFQRPFRSNVIGCCCIWYIMKLIISYNLPCITVHKYLYTFPKAMQRCLENIYQIKSAGKICTMLYRYYVTYKLTSGPFVAYIMESDIFRTWDHPWHFFSDINAKRHGKFQWKFGTLWRFGTTGKWNDCLLSVIKNLPVLALVQWHCNLEFMALMAHWPSHELATFSAQDDFTQILCQVNTI